MKPLDVFNRVTIASPCPANWDDMAGNKRSRFCESCRKYVYNLSEMRSSEAAALIERTEGKLCARLYRRRDGTLLTADCPVGLAGARRGRLRKLAARAFVGLAVLAAGVFVAVAGGPGRRPEFTPPPTGPGVTLEDWKDWALVTLGVRERRAEVAVGMMIFDTEGMPPSCESSDSY